MSEVCSSVLPFVLLQQANLLFYDYCLRKLINTTLQWCAENLKGRHFLSLNFKDKASFIFTLIAAFRETVITAFARAAVCHVESTDWHST